MSNVQLGYTQVIDPISFKSIPSGKIYIGEYGTLPNPANAGTWKQAYFVNSDGTRTAASQPIATNAAGYAVDGSGNIKSVQVDGQYSILVQSSLGVTKFSSAKPTNEVAVQDVDLGNGRTQADKNAEIVSALDFGAVGDGVTDDTAAFTMLEASVSGLFVDLCGRNYKVTNIPIANKYFNGNFIRASDGTVIPANWGGSVRAGRYLVAIGQDAALNVSDYTGTSDGTNIIAIGRDALRSNVTARNNYAIGHGALKSLTSGTYNLAVGYESQLTTNGTGTGFAGTRNVSLGDNSLRFNGQGYNNVAVGRNAGQAIQGGYNNISIGTGASAGRCPVDLSGEIVNPFPLTGYGTVAIGTNALTRSLSGLSTAVGYNALSNLKSALGTTAIGALALQNIEANISENGRVLTQVSKTGTYSASGTSIQCTITGHGFITNDDVYLAFTSGQLNNITSDYIWFNVTVTDVNTFTLTSSVLLPASTGNISVTEFATGTAATTSNYNTAVGYNAIATPKTTIQSTAVGASALNAGGKSDNTAIGFRSAAYLDEANNTIRNTAVGSRALELMQDGSNATNIFNSSALGYQAYVSGSSQVQLGNSSTTVYVYGTVQNRSDLRDKADVRDTILGLDFIKQLRPVDYRWDMREDYIYLDDGGNVNHLPKDGSKKRFRFHHGLIAQEVKALCDSVGVDFGGLQDHTVNGGCDVLSLGYDELIAPLIKAVQEVSARQDIIEQRLNALEIK